MRYQDLPETTLPERGGWGAGAAICCSNPDCIEHQYGNTYSATRGDYFFRNGTAEILCAECSEPMELVRRVELLEVIERPEQ